MSGSTRIRGKQLRLTLGSSPATDHWCDTTAVTLENEDADVVTYCDAANGTDVQEYLSITGIQSTDPDSLWTYLWDNAGQEVPFVYAPWGNEEPSAAQPHFIGMCTLGPRPAVGGEAGRTNTFTFETRWDVVGTVVKDTGSVGD